jgi:hypothetical protein
MGSKEDIEAARDRAVHEIATLGDTASIMTAGCHTLAMLLLFIPEPHRSAALSMALRQVRETVETFKGGQQ